MAYLASLILGYLFGSIAIAYFVGRRRGVFVEETDEQGAGVAATYKALGRGGAAIVACGDALKGLLAALIGLAIAGPAGAYVGLAAAIIGDCFPLLGRIAGGRGVTTFAGGALVIAPFAWAIAIEFGVIVWLASTRRRALWWGLLSFPIWQLITKPSGGVAGTVGLLALLGLRWLELRKSKAQPEAERLTSMAKRRSDRAHKLADAAQKEFASARAHESRGQALASEAQRLTQEAQDQTDRARPKAKQRGEEAKREPTSLEQDVDEAATQAGQTEQRVRQQQKSKTPA